MATPANVQTALAGGNAYNYLLCMARPERFELPTAWFVAIYSHSNSLFLIDVVQSARCHFIST